VLFGGGLTMATSKEIAKIAKLSSVERIAAAKEKTRKVVDHLLYLIALHESNALVLYSPLLCSQVITASAANAFDVFRHSLYRFEIVRLSALWDSIDLAKENVPTIIELVDHPAVLDALEQELASSWGNAPTDPPELQHHEREFGAQHARNVRDKLRKAIDEARAIICSARLRSVMNLRDKRLAHSLAQTQREKAGPIDPMKYGDERALLDATLPIVQALYSGINHTHFSFDNSREIAQQNANALWQGCKFKTARSRRRSKRARAARTAKKSRSSKRR
jgi:hypothetical protein